MQTNENVEKQREPLTRATIAQRFRRHAWLIGPGLAFAFVVVLWLLTKPGMTAAFGEDPATRGQAGDMFGAVNALFAGLAFASVVVALFMQRKDLLIQQQDLKATQAIHAERNQIERAFQRDRLAVDLIEEWVGQHADDARWLTRNDLVMDVGEGRLLIAFNARDRIIGVVSCLNKLLAYLETAQANEDLVVRVLKADLAMVAEQFFHRFEVNHDVDDLVEDAFGEWFAAVYASARNGVWGLCDRHGLRQKRTAK